MFGTGTENNSEYGKKLVSPHTGEHKRRACEEFRYDFTDGMSRYETRPEETYFYGDNQPMMFEESAKTKSKSGGNAERGLAVFLTVAAVLLALISAFSVLTGFGVIKNYTGLFEDPTAETASDADSGAYYTYTAETSENETVSGENTASESELTSSYDASLSAEQ